MQEEAFGHLTVQDYIMVSNSVTRIRGNAFHLGEKAHVQCNWDSYARRYCIQNYRQYSVDTEYKQKRQEKVQK